MRTFILRGRDGATVTFIGISKMPFPLYRRCESDTNFLFLMFFVLMQCALGLSFPKLQQYIQFASQAKACQETNRVAIVHKLICV